MIKFVDEAILRFLKVISYTVTIKLKILSVKEEEKSLNFELISLGVICGFHSFNFTFIFEEDKNYKTRMLEI